MARWIVRSITASLLLPLGCAGRNADVALEQPPASIRILPVDQHPSPEQLAELRTAMRARMAAVVEIRTEFHEPPPQTDDSAAAVVVVKESGGSGIIIDPSGIILTNSHVVADATFVFVRVGEREVPAQKVAVHDELDLAMVRVSEPLDAAMPYAAAAVGPGLPVVALSGVPEQSGGATGLVTRSRVSLQEVIDPQRRLDYSHLIECSAPLRPGFSGGPVIAADGRWVGISVAAAETPDKQEARGYAIPLNEVTRIAILELRQQLDAAQPR